MTGTEGAEEEAEEAAAVLGRGGGDENVLEVIGDGSAARRLDHAQSA